jgi:hypothetical protein
MSQLLREILRDTHVKECQLLEEKISYALQFHSSIDTLNILETIKGIEDLFEYTYFRLLYLLNTNQESNNDSSDDYGYHLLILKLIIHYIPSYINFIH